MLKPEPPLQRITEGRREDIRGRAARVRLGTPPHAKATASRARAKQPRAQPGWQERFLEAYRASAGNVARAAEAAGVSRQHPYKVRDRDPEFAQAMDDIRAGVIDVAETELYRRGFIGVDRPVYQGGKQVGTVREFDTRAAELWLKANAPEKYRERMQAEVSGRDGGPIPIELIDQALRDAGYDD